MTIPNNIPSAWKPFTGETSTPEKPGLIQAFLKAQRNIRKATKHAENPHFKSKYADLSEVMDACLSALNAQGIAVFQPASANGADVTVTTMLVHESGEYMMSALTLVAMPHTPQAVGSCITYGRRYGLASLVGVASEDDDGQEASTAPGRKIGRSRATPPEAMESRRASVAPTTESKEVLNTVTGELAPAGYHFVHSYAVNGKWHSFIVDGLDGNGDDVKLSTQYDTYVELMKQCAEQHAPCKVQWKPKGPGEGYLNKLERYGDEDEPPF